MTKGRYAVSREIAADSLVESIVNRLALELDLNLAYHSQAHTIDVIDEALSLAKLDGVDEDSLLRLAVAAAFHDAGFLAQRTDHEEIGARMAADAMAADSRFNPADIDLVAKMILDTRVNPHGPVHRCTTKLSPWLLDADMANFGRQDFFRQTELIAQEMQVNITDMVSNTLDLMDRHSWQSPAGIKRFDAKKQENRSLLEQRLQTR
jgi:uncharacterized protein